ncbi:myeloblastin-like [Ochlerotatus camptorhynchus]|uniref:myeloblastin-like n=1 Tax=Ochlerotatus camptorhynchus TaxID=644619 RepID=UPI0031D24575
MISYVTISLVALLMATVRGSVTTVTRIIGGTDAPLEDFPYMVSIRLNSLENPAFGDGFFCQGVLVSPKAVLTSTECVLNGSGSRIPEELSLVLGTTSRTNASGSVDAEAEQIWLQNGGHLAMLKLKRGVAGLRLGVLNEFVQDANKRCIVVGWGANSTDGKPKDRLQEVYVNISKEKCQDSMICTSAANEKGGGVCFWDTGAPLLCDGSLSGILMGRPDKCGPEITTFVSIRTEWDWIRSQIAAANSGHRLISTGIIIVGLLMAVK